MNAIHPEIGQVCIVKPASKAHYLSNGQGVLIQFRPSSLTERVNVRINRHGRCKTFVLDLELARRYFARLKRAGYR